MSTDEGESRELHKFPKHHEGDWWSYCRDVAIKSGDANVMFVGNGDTIPGVTGAIQVTRDGGATWRKLKQEFDEIRAVTVTPK